MLAGPQRTAGPQPPAQKSIVTLKNSKPHWIRQRGLIHVRLRNFGSAVSDLERYLALVPGAEDQRSINEQLAVLRQLRGMVN